MSTPTFFDPLGVGGVTQLPTGSGPIIGDPEPVIRLNPAQYLTTGDLGQGDPGEAGGLASMAFEMWFVTSNSYPTGGCVVVKGPIGDGTTRQWAVTLNQAGTVVFGARSASHSNIGATSSVTLSTYTWYHIVGTLEQGVSCNIYINGTLYGTTAWNDSVVPYSEGLVGFLDMQLGSSSSADYFYFADVAFYRQALSATRVAAHYAAGVARGYSSNSTSGRINSVLNTMGSTASRTIGAGTRSVTARYMTGQSPLDAIREAVTAEAVDAAFFCSKSGSLVFLPDGHRSSSPYNTVQATFDDDGTDYPYVDITLDYSDSFIANEVNATAEGTEQVPGQMQTATDATSVAKYLKRPMFLTGLPVTTDAAASTIASAMLAKYKEPMQRITGLTFATVDPSAAAAIFSRDIGDRIRVFRTSPGGGARIDQTLFIQKIEVDGDPNQVKVRWGVSPL